jgi:hypothetical protein
MRQLKHPEVVPSISETKLAAEAFELDIADDQVGLARDPVGNDRPLYAGNDGLHVRFVQAQDRCTIEWDPVYELYEAILDVFERTVLVEVFAVDRGNHRDNRGQQQETAIAFVGFHDEKFTFAESCSCACLVHAAAHHECRIEVRRGKHRRNDGS